MGKTRAEIQKAYRNLKKSKEGSSYLRKETERVKRYYKPTTEIRPSQLEVRRERVRLCMRRKRQQQKDARRSLSVNEQRDTSISGESVESSEGPCDSTTNITQTAMPSTSTSSRREEQLVVKMNFEKGRGKWNKSKSLKRAEEKVKILELRVNTLKRKNDCLRKRLQRGSVINSPLDSSTGQTANETNEESKTSRKRKHPDSSDLTPKSKSKEDLRSEGISPRKHQKLVKKLTFHNTILGEVKDKILPDRGRSRQRSSLEIICGKVLKRYRLGSRCSKELGVHRGQILKTQKGKDIRKSRKPLERAQMSASVTRFLEREDNSACLPGKRDATKSSSGMRQNRVLNDYLYNLHLKYKSENPGVNVSLTTFSSYRPSYMKLVKYSSRRTCLCQRHQNIALKVKGMKSFGATGTENPDSLIKQNTDEEILQRLRDCESDIIKFSQWKRKEVKHKGKLTKRMMIENVQMHKDEFIDMFRKDLTEFRKHTERVKCQYQQVQVLKETMPQRHAICQMDFAENYSCGHADEIQTAYFDKCSVTLHPVVVYTKDAEGTMSHKSYIYVSDMQAHNSGTVYAFTKRITNELKFKCPDIECIHYITDSPTSQYRNKTMMYVVANHDQLFGLKASWQYWEAGHGKGPCDGVGGSSKRLADMAVKRQTAVIQSAKDYYDWGKSQASSQTSYCFVPKEECDSAQTELSCLNIKPIKGTLEIHSVVCIRHGEIAVRNTSCFCERCFENGEFKVFCEGWVVHSFKKQTDDQNDRKSAAEDNAEAMPINEQNQDLGEPVLKPDEVTTDQEETHILVNTYVAAVYNGHWYVGKVIGGDPEDEDLPYQVSFMEHGKGKVYCTFKWPTKEDILWRGKSDILCVISEPVPHGTRKMFKLQESDIRLINEAFQNYK